jgi:hypothetical protein
MALEYEDKKNYSGLLRIRGFVIEDEFLTEIFLMRRARRINLIRFRRGARLLGFTKLKK